MNNLVIKATKLGKKFCKDQKAIMKYGLADLGKNILGIDIKTDYLRKKEFWALKEVSFSVEQGETLGIIGSNGSGKSTLLKMLHGIFMPDKGEIEIKGKTGALIDIGVGFHNQLTGRENIYFNATILGMKMDEIKTRFKSIVDFAEIRNFLDTPLKNYSSGMLVRLGFSIAIHCQPDILLIDEVLSVGDEAFREKCLKRMAEIKRQGKTIIFVSHNLDQVQTICDRLIWLEKGRINLTGLPDKVISQYLEDNEFAQKKN